MVAKISGARTALYAASLALALLALLPACQTGEGPRARATATFAAGIHKIQHVVVIMQENRSFDSYFGTFPGADGIPMKNGTPSVCVPDPKNRQCVRPYPDHADVNGGGPHGAASATADIDHGKMDGFIAQAEAGQRGCTDQNNPVCANAAVPDVMGYHDGSDIPNYWAYARQFVLQDHMFEPTASWSLPAHLFLVSEWSAVCSKRGAPMSCKNSNATAARPPDFGPPPHTPPN
ncbi:MAG TPA: alkaline phosphatase family protein, partial [Dehalococcoidia bacterium]|nr:alkaline phosphatase family protein [Dehalococcoidia bacterium]